MLSSLKPFPDSIPFFIGYALIKFAIENVYLHASPDNYIRVTFSDGLFYWTGLTYPVQCISKVFVLNWIQMTPEWFVTPML